MLVQDGTVTVRTSFIYDLVHVSTPHEASFLQGLLATPPSFRRKMMGVEIVVVQNQHLQTTLKHFKNRKHGKPLKREQTPGLFLPQLVHSISTSLV